MLFLPHRQEMICKVGGGLVSIMIRFGNSELNARGCITYYTASTRNCLR